ncbi:hypothetical protein Q7P37_001997 [Cladosporium fusiforme]
MAPMQSYALSTAILNPATCKQNHNIPIQTFNKLTPASQVAPRKFPIPSHVSQSTSPLTKQHDTNQVIQAWKQNFTLFIPELPGYGISPPPPTPDKRTIGLSILSALQITIPNSPSRKIHWIGHDRGARIGHRLLTAPTPPPNLHAAVLIDIVPTLAQWQSFSHPAAATAYFHWPFLATPLAPDLIRAAGGASFCHSILARGRGSNEEGIRSLESDGAYAHYTALFDSDAAIEGSCADYADGSTPECEAQTEEQAQGRKVDVPLLVVYSEGYLGRMHDVQAVWKGWVADEAKLSFLPVGDGHGHYLPESADGVVAEVVARFVGENA